MTKNKQETFEIMTQTQKKKITRVENTIILLSVFLLVGYFFFIFKMYE